MTPVSALPSRATAEPALFERLVDDAAVFPPGLAPLPRAVREHRAHRTRWYAGLLGPLLVPASSAGELRALVPADSAALRVGLVTRPGAPLAALVDGLRLLLDHRSVEVVGVEAGWSPQWRELELAELPVVLELPRGELRDDALDDVAAAVAEDSRAVLAKFRTGATPTWPWPDEAELAGFLDDVVDRGVPFKLTGGLHHAVRGSHGPEDAREEQHGLLNVLAALDARIRGGTRADVAGLLAERSAAHLAELVSGIDAGGAARLRAHLTAYGCCGVTDPIRELSALQLVEER